MSRMPLAVHSAYPDTTRQAPENLVHEDTENPSSTLRDETGYPGTVGHEGINGVGSIRPRVLDGNTGDTDAETPQPMFLVDYARNPDYEIGGQAGEVNTNPYTFGAVVPWEDFDLSGVTARIRWRPEGGPNPGGPVTGRSVSGGTWDQYAAQLAQKRSIVPSQDEIAMSLLGADGNYGTKYDSGFPA